MSDVGGPDVTGEAGAQAACSPLRRTVDLCVFAPVGVALSVIEDLPGLIAKGRNRVERHIGNAHVVGRFVVDQGQRTLAGRLGSLRESGAEETGPHDVPGAAPHQPESRVQRPAPDPLDGAAVGRALADYDTLSASQVVRRLESLGPEELRAVQRYEASTRNRRTILNRAGQLLAERAAAPHPEGGNGTGPRDGDAATEEHSHRSDGNGGHGAGTPGPAG